MVSDWRVAEEMVTLSDRRHIIFDVTPRSSNNLSRPVHSSLPARRWALKRLNRDMFIAAANVVAWPENDRCLGISPDPEEEAAWFRDKMTSICDTSMPRVSCVQRPGAVYWWSEDLA
ncbi:hypothetical protein PYW08_014470 [Mythimna loreyi]|uniref:Uncharacterized protein n=1 Tax=Mythimna loreyi TaxID=667449 RepID=A0ACC2R205_9NEOP|nr:hypothetical protein PYW08_014470 [Mythimna loreyi]